MSGRSEKKAAAGPSSLPASPAGEMPAVKDSRWLVPGVCIFLAAIVWVVFGQTLHHGFVNYDDNLYVYENSAVTRGLDLKGVEWAFTHIVVFNWHPLTVLSHMLDCQLYGLKPGGHHLTNVLLHTASVILLFLVLRRMTGFLWRSAFVAAVFAIHPLRVESVAWVAERKDVLSGVFFMLTLWAYARYVASGKWQVTGTGSTPSPANRHPSLFYWLVLGFFALGLMSKPMLVTLPFVLLLLDYWPLGRVTRLHFASARPAGGEWRGTGPDSRFPPQISRLFLEKLPLFGLAVASCAITIFAQQDAIQSFEQISLPLRVGNASISYVAYLGQMFWPSGLAVLYPFTAAGIEIPEVMLSLVLLAGISTGAYVLRRQRPCYLIGWLWYLIMLTPVVGIVQAGAQARADRYTYLPQIGLYLMLTWAAAELSAGWRQRRVVLGGGATVILVALILCARGQTSHWRNGESLWTHTLDCTSGNYVAHNNLGNVLLKMNKVDDAMVHFQKALEIKPDFAEAHLNLGIALLQQGHVDEAIVHCRTALRIRPDFAEAHLNLGIALLQQGHVDEAIAQYQKALQIVPDSAIAHNNLGNALFQKGKVDEAIVHFQKALESQPDNAKTHNNLGSALFKKGDVDEAIVHFQKALQIKPDYAGACYSLGNAVLQKGQVDEAIAHYQEALQIKPDYLDVLNNLAWLLATYPDARTRNGTQAVKYAERACELTHYGVTVLVGTLAAAYAEAGRYDDAIVTAQKACALAEKSGEQDLLEKNQKLLELYRAHQPYHEAAGKFVPAVP
jgi:tetratricopeptide (TPR) repeat protein